jgi:hypothetical protein
MSLSYPKMEYLAGSATTESGRRRRTQHSTVPRTIHFCQTMMRHAIERRHFSL